MACEKEVDEARGGDGKEKRSRSPKGKDWRCQNPKRGGKTKQIGSWSGDARSGSCPPTRQ